MENTDVTAWKWEKWREFAALYFKAQLIILWKRWLRISSSLYVGSTLTSTHLMLCYWKSVMKINSKQLPNIGSPFTTVKLCTFCIWSEVFWVLTTYTATCRLRARFQKRSLDFQGNCILCLQRGIWMCKITWICMCHRAELLGFF